MSTCKARIAVLVGLAVWLAVLSSNIRAAHDAAAARPGQEATQVFARELTRGIRLIAEDHINPATEAQMVRWSVQGLYKAVQAPLPKSTARRLAEADNATPDELMKLLRDARADLGQREALEGYKGHEVCLRAIFAHLEPAAEPEKRSCFIRPENIHRWISGGIPASPSGVGLQLDSDPASGMIRVQTPVRDSPAYSAGLRAGDLITHITIDTDKDGKPLPAPQKFATKGMSVERAEELLLGRWGTRVVLTVIPATGDRDQASRGK